MASKYSRFTQQELPAWRPVLTPGWVWLIASFVVLVPLISLINIVSHLISLPKVIALYIALGAVFIPIGLVSLSTSNHVVEIVYRYDNVCIPSSFSKNEAAAYIKNPETNKSCHKTLTVPKDMKSPIFVYYQLDNFYQNHRHYVKSRSDKQLRSHKFERETRDCAPEVSFIDDFIVPCGLIAWSLFNDTYEFSAKDKVLEVNKKGIAWKSETGYKFGSDVYPKNFQRGDLIGGGNLDTSKPLSEQEDLIVWMRTAALPNFRKLYGRIHTDLEANENITVVIQNNYNTYSFGGKKKLVLSTTSSIGGKNDFLGKAYLIVGGLSIFIGIIYILMHVYI